MKDRVKKTTATRSKKKMSDLEQLAAALPELISAMNVSKSDIEMNEFGVGKVIDAEGDGIRLLMLLADKGALPEGFVG